MRETKVNSNQKKLLFWLALALPMLLTACSTECDDDQYKKGSWPNESCAYNSDSTTTTVSRTDSSLTAYLPNGTYTSSGLNWCTNGACDSAGTPAACSGVTTFGDVGGDFTVYSDTQATFWSSITETVSFNTSSRQVTLTTNDTGHISYTFTYEYIGGSPKNWEITYGTNCGRLYKCHLGDCAL